MSLHTIPPCRVIFIILFLTLSHYITFLFLFFIFYLGQQPEACFCLSFNLWCAQWTCAGQTIPVTQEHWCIPDALGGPIGCILIWCQKPRPHASSILYVSQVFSPELYYHTPLPPCQGPVAPLPPDLAKREPGGTRCEKATAETMTNAVECPSVFVLCQRHCSAGWNTQTHLFNEMVLTA